MPVCALPYPAIDMTVVGVFCFIELVRVYCGLFIDIGGLR